MNREAHNIGQPSPLGATIVDNSINFSLFSRTATGVELHFFDQPEDARPTRTISLDPVVNRTHNYWHISVPGVQSGQLYGYKVSGPANRSNGLLFDPTKLLLDPYGRSVAVPHNYDRQAAARPGDNTAVAMKSVVIDPGNYDWEGDVPLRSSSAHTIIYEMHVGGFTRHPTSGLCEKTRGTYSGLIDKIPYLQKLGITAVELLPVFQFDAQDCPKGLVNYWGYQPVSFFSPHQGYSSRKDPLGPVNEFRDMVKALHRTGIEIILDVVFNHTAEGNEGGPTFCFRGLDNPTYYMLQKDRSRYADYSGCGNTLNANNPIVFRMIVDSIHYWVEHMHVDGFRFDLASILSRDITGHVLPNPPVLQALDTDPALAGIKLIAEAWDAAGLNQVGSFIGDTWKEWNGRFRDDVRSFFRGDPGAIRPFADRFVGSPDIYRHKDREPEQSINFVTCHDGFTLNDLVSYNQKHNESNGEKNRDGGNDNLSWNCGVEGPSDDPKIEKLRNRQVKNFLAVTLLSIGVPMILMGDEVRRSQQGNNNYYCHDDPAAWFDWSLLNKRADVHRFVSLLNARRALRSITYQQQRLTLHQLLEQANKQWHGVKLNQPDWSDSSYGLALTAELNNSKVLVHLMFSANSEALEFELPKIFGNQPIRWRRWFDTSLESPNDITPWEEAPSIESDKYKVDARSVVMLFTQYERKPT